MCNLRGLDCDLIWRDERDFSAGGFSWFIKSLLVPKKKRRIDLFFNQHRAYYPTFHAIVVAGPDVHAAEIASNRVERGKHSNQTAD